MVKDPVQDQVCSSQQEVVFIFWDRLFSAEGHQLLPLWISVQINLRDYFSTGQKEDEDVWDLVGLVHMASGRPCNPTKLNMSDLWKGQ